MSKNQISKRKLNLDQFDVKFDFILLTKIFFEIFGKFLEFGV